ncbi:MAG: GntR family transcriptional regulator [Gaiellaceae bacterium]
MVAAAEQHATASLAEQAYRALRELIVSLELPPTALIREPDLMERLGIGRTPIREALRRLAHEQLVAVYPRRGIIVTGVDIRDLARLSEVREAIESQAARLAAERATDADRAELDALLAELESSVPRDERALMALDERIHAAVYRAAHNDFLQATAGQYYTLALRIWYLALDRAKELEGAVHEHRALLEAIRDGDAARAEAQMRDHVQRFEQAMRRVLLTS